MNNKAILTALDQLSVTIGEVIEAASNKIETYVVEMRSKFVKNLRSPEEAEAKVPPLHELLPDLKRDVIDHLEGAPRYASTYALVKQLDEIIPIALEQYTASKSVKFLLKIQAQGTAEEEFYQLTVAKMLQKNPDLADALMRWLEVERPADAADFEKEDTYEYRLKIALEVWLMDHLEEKS